jgi:hypothetical protein
MGINVFMFLPSLVVILVFFFIKSQERREMGGKNLDDTIQLQLLA